MFYTLYIVPKSVCLMHAFSRYARSLRLLRGLRFALELRMLRGVRESQASGTWSYFT